MRRDYRVCTVVAVFLTGLDCWFVCFASFSLLNGWSLGATTTTTTTTRKKTKQEEED
jgi:hypothetical protein